MVDSAHGYRAVASWQREPLVSVATWPATAAVAATQGLPLRAAQVSDGVQVAFHTSTAQGYGPDAADVVSISPSEVWTCPLRYEGFEQLLACALGYQARRLSSVLLPFELATGVYRHRFELDTALATTVPWAVDDGFTALELATPLMRVRRATAVVCRDVSVWELRSAMVRSLTLSAGLADGVLLQVELVGYERRRDSVVNTLATMRALPLSAAPNVLLRHGVVRLAPWSASVALDAGDRVVCQSWQLTLANQLDASPGPRTGLFADEYERTALPHLALSLNLPRYQSDTAFTDLIAAAPLMGDITLTGPAIGATGYFYQVTLSLPRFHLAEVRSDLQGPGPPTCTHQAILEVPPSAPAGFPATHHLGPLTLELVNTVAAHALLD